LDPSVIDLQAASTPGFGLLFSHNRFSFCPSFAPQGAKESNLAVAGAVGDRSEQFFFACESNFLPALGPVS
jgi:hypothetical protein